MICARSSINADTGASLFYISFAEVEYFQPCNALAHLNPSANSNKFELVPCMRTADRLCPIYQTGTAGIHFFIGDKAQGRTVNAVAHAIGGLRIAGEHMAEVGVSGAASDLRAAHSVAQILFFHHSGALDRLCKGGPAAAALVLIRGGK